MRYLKRSIIKSLFLLCILFILISIIGMVIYGRYPLYHKGYIYNSTNKYKIDPYLVVAIINVESGFNKRAVSSKNARGLMQISEQTGEWAAKVLEIDDYQKENLYDPKLNIEFGCWYLAKLNEEFDGDLNLVLAAYNGGSGNVNKWLKDAAYSKDGKELHKIPFKETENYLVKVKSNYRIYKKIYKDIDFQKDYHDSIFINYIYNLINYIKEIE